MDKKYLVSNNLCFLVSNKKESEYTQKYLFNLGFIWWNQLNLMQIINFSKFPFLIIPGYDELFLDMMNFLNIA